MGEKKDFTDHGSIIVYLLSHFATNIPLAGFPSFSHFCCAIETFTNKSFIAAALFI
jgi:hypothetical protein